MVSYSPLNRVARSLTDIVLEITSGLKEVAKTGIAAANPVTDAYRFAGSACRLLKAGGGSVRSAIPLIGKKGLSQVVSEGWKVYKGHLKQGSFLGGENVRNVILYGGLFAGGLPVYIPFLATRFGIGVAAHACKSALSYASRYTPIPSATKKKLQDALQNNDYFRKNIMPVCLDAAIALKSYGGIVFSKWIAGGVEYIGSCAKGKNTSGLRAIIGGLIMIPAGIVKTALSDYLALTIAQNGLVRAESLDEKIKQWSDPKTALDHPFIGNLLAGHLRYFVSHEFASDLKHEAVGTLVSAKDRVVSAVNSAVTPENLYSALSGIGSALTYPFDGRLVSDAGQFYTYVSSGQIVADAKIGCEKRGSEFASDLRYSGMLFKQIALSNLGDLAHSAGVDPSDTYAIIVTGSHDDFIKNMAQLEQAELTKHGVPPAHIVSISPDHVSEAAIRYAYEQVSSKMDWNDKVVVFIDSHGSQEVEINTGRMVSYASIERTHEHFTEDDLHDMNSLIKNGFGVTLMSQCYGQTFARGATPNVFVITASGDEPAWSQTDGRGFSIRLLELARDSGGTIFDYVKDPISLWRMVQKGAYLHNKDTHKDQRPHIGINGRHHDIRGMGQD